MQGLISPGTVAVWLGVGILAVLLAVCLVAGAVAIYAIVRAFQEDRADVKAKGQEKSRGLRKP